MDALTYIFAAYTIIWLLIFGYTYYLSRRQKGVEREVELLRSALEQEDLPP